MADFPGSEVTNAISKVISSVIPPQTHVYLVALVPGVFFELSILLANPSVFCELVARAQDASGLGKYAIGGIALFFAFIIGNAFILAVTLIQRIFGHVYRLLVVVWEELCIWPLFPVMTWLGRKPWFGRRRRLRDFGERVQLTVSQTPIDEGARKLWSLLAGRLLREKYAIEPKLLDQEEWDALYWTLGTLRIEDIRGAMTMIVSEATGWCGIAAIRFAPTLRNRYYVALCTLMIVAGLVHDWYVAEGLNNRTFIGFLKTRSLLREFPKLAGRGQESQLTNQLDDPHKR